MPFMESPLAQSKSKTRPNESLRGVNNLGDSIKEKDKALFAQFIYKGGELIKQGKYSEAINHFHKEQEAQRAGFLVSRGREQFLSGPPAESEIEDIANFVAKNSWFKDDRTIQLGGAHLGFPQGESNPAVQKLLHEIALVNLEEWLHALQSLKGASIAGYSFYEVDVAAYMHKNNIPMTPAFLRRYDRGLSLYGADGLDDSLSKSPALRKGSFVRVRRSNGAVDENWQINRFDLTTGDIVARQLSDNLERTLTREEVADLNETGVYPFINDQDMEKLFSHLDSLKYIQGSNNLISSTELKKLINQVRFGTASLAEVPRAGGLRLKVAELAGLSNSVSPALVRTPTFKR
jgi:hypothetical protein